MTHLTITSLNFDADLVTTRAELMRTYATAVGQNKPSLFIAWNPEKILKTFNREDWPAIRTTGLNYADGVGITIASRWLTNKKIERIPGVDFFQDVLALLNQTRGKLFMFGAQETILNQAVQNVQKKFPDLVIVGFAAGFDFDDQSIVDRIDALKPDVIAVALGSPKQEEWIFRHGLKAKSGVFIGVGGTFSILSGTLKRAPKLFQTCGMEWFYRLISEPSRVKRQIVLPIFLWHLMKEKCRQHKAV